MRSDYLNESSGKEWVEKRPVEKLENTAAFSITLNASQSGTLFQVDMSNVDNNVAMTLPTASSSAGVYYDFCFNQNCDDDADFSITTGDNDVDIYGYVVTGAADSTVDDFNGLSKITVDGSVSQAVEGLRLTVVCDGTNWHLSGYVPVAIGTVDLVESASA